MLSYFCENDKRRFGRCLFLNFSHILLSFGIVGGWFFALFAFEKQNMSFVKFMFYFLTDFILGVQTMMFPKLVYRSHKFSFQKFSLRYHKSPKISSLPYISPPPPSHPKIPSINPYKNKSMGVYLENPAFVLKRK